MSYFKHKDFKSGKSVQKKRNNFININLIQLLKTMRFLSFHTKENYITNKFQE